MEPTSPPAPEQDFENSKSFELKVEVKVSNGDINYSPFSGNNCQKKLFYLGNFIKRSELFKNP